MRAYERVRESLKQGRTILLDGGVGTEILRRGVYWRCHGMEQKPEAVEAVRQAASVLDKAAQKGVIHKRTAARRKSRLMKKLHANQVGQK